MSHSFASLYFVLAVAAGGYAASPDGQNPPVFVTFDFDVKSATNPRLNKQMAEMFNGKLQRWTKAHPRQQFITFDLTDVRGMCSSLGWRPKPETSLAEMARIVRDQFDADYASWGRIAQVHPDGDVYDIHLCIGHFPRNGKPEYIVNRQGRTQTAQEIPHVYVKEALDALLGRTYPDQGPDPEEERRWREGPNLIRNGGFEKMDGQHPVGWDPQGNPAQHVSFGPDPVESSNRCVKFQFPKSIADSSGVLYYSELIPLQENAKYRFQCRWYSTGPQVKIFIKCGSLFTSTLVGGRLAKQKEHTQFREVYRSQQNLYGDQNQWNVQTEDFTSKHTKYPIDRGRVMLYAYHPAGTVYFDDVVIKLLRPAPRQEGPKVKRKSLETKVIDEE